MKYAINLIVFLFFTVHAMGQSLPQNISIASIKHEHGIMACRLQSPNPFYVGAQAYILHIGGQQFDLSLQEDNDSLHTLVFLMPIAQYNLLPPSAATYLSYGPLLAEQQSAIEHSLADVSLGKTCTYLGVFTKPELHK